MRLNRDEMLRIPFFAHRNLSLRSRLLILLALVACVLVADRASDIVERRSHLIETARDRLTDIARRGAERQEDVLSDVRALLTLATEMPEASPRSGPDACRLPFSKTVDAIPWLVSLAAVRLDGTMFCSSRVSNLVGSLADRPYFREAVESRSFVLSDYLTVRFDKKPGLIAAMPRFVDGEIDSLVVARLDLDWFDALVRRVGETGRVSTVLTDRSGTIVAAYPDQDGIVGRNATTLGLPQAGTRTREALFDIVGPDGEARIYAVSALVHAGGQVFVSAARKEILAPIREQIWAASLKLAGALLVFVSLMWLAVERLVVRPASRLAAVSARFGKGDLTARAETTDAPGEFARLADAFNVMAARLEGRDSELRAVNERLAELATVDPLTALANRRLFDERLAQEWRRASRNGRPLGLVIVDVDFFKAFNDTYGHPAGDVCLRQIARAASSGLRPSDLAARLGGEEFAILLPGADQHRTLHVARLLRLQIETLAVPHAGSPLRVVTVSAGAVSVQPSAESGSAEILLRSADEALYGAKRGGRNQVAGSGPAALAS